MCTRKFKSLDSFAGNNRGQRERGGEKNRSYKWKERSKNRKKGESEIDSRYMEREISL